ncbi:type I restriction enzyme S subunit [Paraburkholderia sp. RAU6.4a]|uniref:restriction endonuclease subunit S n=1 Tax=Paraburkholderia sp. RAU6.4a TaxID=2991067 RepID=UPI003D1F8D58
MSLPRYPQYKDSEVAWLHDVPAHWRISPLKYLASLKSGGTPSKDNLDYWDGEVPWASAKDLKTDTLADTIDHVTSFAVESGNADLLPEGTILVVVRGMILARTFPVAETLVSMAINQDLKGIIPRKVVTGRFLAWLLRGTASESLLRLDEAGHGTKALRMDAWTSMQLPIPPVDEQSTIAAFLDRETGKIDALIAEQEKLLTLLAEKRQATISHAVTRGLNPDAPVKDSGVDWLGRVPAHWQVVPLAYRYNVQLGKMLDSSKITGEHLRPYLRVFDVQWGYINTNELPVMDFDEDAREKFGLVAGDILVNEGGSYPGRSAIWSGTLDECYYQKALHRLRPYSSETDTTHFFYFVLFWAAHQGVFSYGGNETTIEHLPAEKLRRYRFAFPPIEEQLLIASFLNVEIAKLDALGSEVERAIQLLKERRSALISAAVAGKIDVRNAASQELAA